MSLEWKLDKQRLGIRRDRKSLRCRPYPRPLSRKLEHHRSTVKMLDRTPAAVEMLDVRKIAQTNCPVGQWTIHSWLEHLVDQWS